MKKRTDLVLSQFAPTFFVVMMLASLGLFFYIISPFWEVLIYAMLTAIIFYPVYEWLLKRLRGQKSVAAFLTTFLVVLLFLVPLTLFVIFLTQEAVYAFELFQKKMLLFDYGLLNTRRLDELPFVGQTLGAWAETAGVNDFFSRIEIDLFTYVQSFGETLSTFLVNQTGSLVFTLGNGMMGFAIFLLTLFFFFRDGSEFSAFLKAISPLPPRHEAEIEAKLKETTTAIVVGTFGTSFIQGLVGGIGLMLAGVSQPLFWTTVMMFSSLMPYVGTMIIWVPLALVLIIKGSLWGWFLMFYGLFVISFVDNLVRPLLIGSSAKTSPLPTFLSVLGAILVLGIKGIIFGPLILGLVLTMIHIYQLEYKDLLKS